jgi:hypothetical protein
MSDYDYWQPTIGAMGAIIDCLPCETQQKIAEHLQLLGQVAKDRGDLDASYYARVLSGERTIDVVADNHPAISHPRPRPQHLKVVR